MKYITLTTALVMISLVTMFIIKIWFNAGVKYGQELQHTEDRKLFMSVSDCLAETHYYVNGRDEGVTWRISPFPFERNCEKEVGKVLHRFLTNQIR